MKSVTAGISLSLAVTAWVATAGEVGSSNALSGTLLLTDSLGRVVSVSTNDVHPALRPSDAARVPRQVPMPTKGLAQSQQVRSRIEECKAGQERLEWFPDTPPVLAPYLANLDDFGNTSMRAGALIMHDPISHVVQEGKFKLSDIGLRENFDQSLTLVCMSDTASGSSTLGYYAADFLGKWAVFEAPEQGLAGWLSLEANAQLGLSSASRTQSPQGNMGTVVNPQANVFGPNGFWLSELAWQQSLRDGQLVVIVGMVDQGNYLDANSYANNSQGQFLNGAFVNSSVLPLPANNPGINLQWQPTDAWYLLFGTGANTRAPGQSPAENMGIDNWSYLLEWGWTPKNVLGLGPGVYRLQPFLATVDGQTQAGLGLNMQQQFGANSPFACFGRFGVGGSQVTLAGASAQVAVGLAMIAPLKQAGLDPRLSDDLLGLGFVWSQPSSSQQTVYHANEYAFEAFYALQLTPTMKVQPDVQVVWNPAFNPDAGPAAVFQLQLVASW